MMRCKQPELSASKMEAAYPFQEVAAAAPGSRRRLMLSDNPEVLDAASFPRRAGRSGMMWSRAARIR